MRFPKLKYPIKTKGLSKESELILLSYDMLWRVNDDCHVKPIGNEDFFWLDLAANLSNLGYYIEHIIAKGHAEFIFELEEYCKEGIFKNDDAIIEDLQLKLFEDAIINE